MRKTAVTVGLLLVLFLTPTAFGATPCQRMCHAGLTVKTAASMTLPGTYKGTDVLQFRVKAGRRWLALEQVNAYDLRFYGAGVVVKIRTPRGRGHIRVRAVNVEARPRRIRIDYRADH